MEVDFPSTHTGCKPRSQSGVTLPGQTPGMILPTFVFPSGPPLPALPTAACARIKYLLQREIFTAFLPLLALYKGTHISFGVFERNNTHKHLPVTGHRDVCRGGQQGTQENNKTPTQTRQQSWLAQGCWLRFALAWRGDFSPFPSGNANPGPG